MDGHSIKRRAPSAIITLYIKQLWIYWTRVWVDDDETRKERSNCRIPACGVFVLVHDLTHLFLLYISSFFCKNSKPLFDKRQSEGQHVAPEGELCPPYNVPRVRHEAAGSPAPAANTNISGTPTMVKFTSGHFGENFPGWFTMIFTMMFTIFFYHDWYLDIYPWWIRWYLSWQFTTSSCGHVHVLVGFLTWF